MMGNVWEWTESPIKGLYVDMNYIARVIRGGNYLNSPNEIQLTAQLLYRPVIQYNRLGFRVASVIPEPTTLLLFGLGGLLIRKRK